MPVRAIAKRAASIFSAGGARFLGAAVAFYALLSAAPLFVVVLHVVGAVFGRERAESALWEGLARWLAPEGLETVRIVTDRLDQAEAKGSTLGVVPSSVLATSCDGGLRSCVKDEDCAGEKCSTTECPVEQGMLLIGQCASTRPLCP